MRFALILLLLTGCTPRSQESCNMVQNAYGERLTLKKLPVTLFISSSVPHDLRSSIHAAAETNRIQLYPKDIASLKCGYSDLN